MRDPRDFAPGHLRGSINIGLGGQYATWAGTLLDHKRPVIIIAAPGRETEAATRLGRIGFDNVAGYLDEGMRALKDREDLVAYTLQTPGAAVTRWIGEPDAPFVLDVRTPGEWQQRHIEGSTHIPLSQLAERLNDIPRNRPVIAMCAGGYRSSIAASLLQRAGFTRVSELTGGIAAVPAKVAADSIRRVRNFFRGRTPSTAAVTVERRSTVTSSRTLLETQRKYKRRRWRFSCRRSRQG